MQREELAYGHMSFASRDPVFVELGPSAQMPRGGWLAALKKSAGLLDLDWSSRLKTKDFLLGLIKTQIGS